MAMSAEEELSYAAEGAKDLLEKMIAAGAMPAVYLEEAKGVIKLCNEGLEESDYVEEPDAERIAVSRAEARIADHIDGYDRDDLGDSPDW